MDKVYIVFAGKHGASHNLVSVHTSVHAAEIAAHTFMAYDKTIASHEYQRRRGQSWKAQSGHYVAIETHSVA